MRVPLRWLSEYVDYPWSSRELAHRLTMSGLKVESLERPAESWADVRIGQVVDVTPHPRSNKPLWVTHVHYGDGLLEIVTGAPNVFAGAKVPVVPTGGFVPFGPEGAPLRIEPRPMAGITSMGMLCSPGELGLDGDNSGILVLPEEAPLGSPLSDFLGEEVLDIETVSNRPDTLSMIGIAREVAALVRTELKLPSVDRWPDNVHQISEESIGVRIKDIDLCSRYSAVRIEGITRVESPAWLAARLESAGLRAISLPVDLTNYVMIETGQPLHAFDANRLRGGEIVVRRASAGETVRTLDGTDREIPDGGLVIADGERAVAVAGVMGGEESEITTQTTAMILESANFAAPSVRRTAQALGLRTDASSRFEKGLSPETTVPAVRRFVQLLAEITGEPIRVARISDVWPVRTPVRIVTMPMRDVRRLLGIDVAMSRAAAILQSLGFGVTARDESLFAEVPFWRRVDVERSADLVEEVGRLVGFDEIPTTLPFRTLRPPAPSPEWLWEGRVRQRLISSGVNEAMTHTLTSPALMSRLFADQPADSAPDWSTLVANQGGIASRGASVTPIPLMNPATIDRQAMRITLLPSLIDITARNLKQDDEQAAFFEIARTYFSRGEDTLAYERRTLAIVLSGRRTPRTWQNANAVGYSFFDLKGVIEATLDEMRVQSWMVEAAPHPSLHPGRSAVLTIAGARVGFLGELHPELVSRFDIDGWPVQVAELDLDSLVENARDDRAFMTLPKFPAAYRDISIVVDEDVPSADILAVVRSEGGASLERARVFDVYRGTHIGSGKKSVAIELILRSGAATLKQQEVDATVSRIVSVLASDLGAVLRD